MFLVGRLVPVPSVVREAFETGRVCEKVECVGDRYYANRAR